MAATAPVSAPASATRVVIRDGLVFDGAGAPPVAADVLVEDGRVARIAARGTLGEVAGAQRVLRPAAHARAVPARGGMTDAPLLAKRLAFIETCVQELRTLARVDLLDVDVREARFVEHTLQLAIQAALDVAGHIVSAERLGEPATNQELFLVLARAGWVGTAQTPALRAMAGFRNVLVHGYVDVDRAIVRDVVVHHLDDLLAFVAAIRARLTEPA